MRVAGNIFGPLMLRLYQMTLDDFDFIQNMDLEEADTPGVLGAIVFGVIVPLILGTMIYSLCPIEFDIIDWLQAHL